MNLYGAHIVSSNLDVRRANTYGACTGRKIQVAYSNYRVSVNGLERKTMGAVVGRRVGERQQIQVFLCDDERVLRLSSKITHKRHVSLVNVHHILTGVEGPEDAKAVRLQFPA